MGSEMDIAVAVELCGLDLMLGRFGAKENLAFVGRKERAYGDDLAPRVRQSSELESALAVEIEDAELRAWTSGSLPGRPGEPIKHWVTKGDEVVVVRCRLVSPIPDGRDRGSRWRISNIIAFKQELLSEVTTREFVFTGPSICH